MQNGSSQTEAPQVRVVAPEKGHQDAGTLLREMQTLATVIQDLEGQQDRLIGSNAALKRELEEERKRRAATTASLDEVQERLRRTERELANQENLAAEVAYLNQERSQLSARVHDLEQRLKVQEQESREQAKVIERLHAARADLLEELGSVESQFERAMTMVSQLRARLASAQEEMEGLRQQLRAAGDRLGSMEDERDSLLQEVDQSRAALDEIRRSLADACRSSESEEGRSPVALR